METGQMFMTQMPTMATVAMAAATPTLPMMAEDASGIAFAAVLQSVAPVIAGDKQVAMIAENKPVVMRQMLETAVKPTLLQAIAISVQPEINLETAAPFSGLPVQAEMMAPNAVNIRQTKEKSDDVIEKEATKEPAAGLPQEVALDAAGAQLAQALQLSGRMPEPELSEFETKATPVVMSSKVTTQPAQMQQVREAYSQPVVNKSVSAVTAPEAAPTVFTTEQLNTFDPSGSSEKSAGAGQTVVHVASVVKEAPVHETWDADSQPVATKTASVPTAAEQLAKPVVASVQKQPLQTIEPKTAEKPQMQTAIPNAAVVVETPKPQAVTASVIEAPKLHQAAPVTIIAETTVKPVAVEQAKAAPIATTPAIIETLMPQAIAAPVVEAPKLQTAPVTIVAETTVKPVAVEQPKAVQATAPTIETSVVEAPKLQAATAPIVTETTIKPVAVEQTKAAPVAAASAVEASVVESPKLQTAPVTIVAETTVKPVVAAQTAASPAVEAPVVEAPKLQAAPAPIVAETTVKPVVAAQTAASPAVEAPQTVAAPVMETPKTQVTQQTHETEQAAPVTQQNHETQQQAPVQQIMEAYSKSVATKPAVIARAEAQTVVPPVNAVMQAIESVALDTVEPVTKTSTLAVAVETAGTNSGISSSVVRNDVSATVTSETKTGNPQVSTQSNAVLPVTVNVPSEPVQAAEVTTGTKRVAESGAVPVRIATKGGEQIREERSVQQTELVISAKSAAGNENLISAALKEPSSVPQEDGSTQENPLFDQKMTGHLQHVSPQQSSNSAVSTAVVAIPEQTQPAALSEHVVKQVNERIAAHEIRSGTDQIVLRLSPENMGEVKVNLRMENQKLTVEIVTDNKTVTDALRQNSDSLKETLAKQNIKMESFDVSTGGNSDNLAGRNSKNLNEWQEMARNKQANQWQQGGYNIPKVAVADSATSLASYRSNGLVDVHY